VDIHGISGVIALKAVHLTKKEEREKPIQTENLYIDIGASTKAEAESYITVGDYGTIESEPFSMGGDLQKGKAWGSRVGCMLALDLLKEDLPVDMEVVFTTQRELGGRGLQTAAFQSEADTAIILDGVPADEGANSPKCGKGGVWMIPLGGAKLPKGILSYYSKYICPLTKYFFLQNLPFCVILTELF
jgi:endoglucanase